VSFCDACGLIAPQPPVVKVLRITGLDQRLPVFTSVHETAIVLGYDSQTTLEELDDQ
jgi:hypothetical protein